jgi:hypothetical protein
MALGLAFQSAALAIVQTFTLPAWVQPARIRLLMLATHGGLRASSPEGPHAWLESGC